MCRVIAIANQKGGTGKTTTCVNLGIGLARAGKKVLLVEADAQGSMAVSLGIQEPDELEETLVNIMEKVIKTFSSLSPNTLSSHSSKRLGFSFSSSSKTLAENVSVFIPRIIESAKLKIPRINGREKSFTFFVRLTYWLF